MKPTRRLLLAATMLQPKDCLTRDISDIAGTDGGRTGSVNGSFFASPTSPVAGQGGNFGITGTGYSAAGTFAGSKQP